ncbi:MAG: helix-turn-helix domain-containing protein [Terrimonas sp.]|nr:helix-turn-helix domain-containing protein [Terrimonas sp.]
MPFYQTYLPTQSLRTIIREIQVFAANWNTEENLPPPFITCLANTEQNLYFFAHDPIKVVPAIHVEIPAPPVIITGPKYIPVGLKFGKDHLMVKVAFHPTGTYRLLGANMEQTVNKGIDAREFWGDDLNDLLEKIKMIPFDQVADLIMGFIEHKFDQQIRPEEPIDTVAIKMLSPFPEHSLADWAAMACLSLRQFERNFLTRVGISPKLFIRIVRFEQAMKIKNEFPEKNWAAIAMECGYADSSHLLKDFKSFADFPPSEFYLKPTSGHSELPTG